MDTDTKEPEEFALTSPGTALTRPRVRPTPTLMQVGNRLVPSDGRYHPDLCAEYIRDRGGRERWIPIGELARVFFCGNTSSNRKLVRRRLFLVFHVLLKQDLLLVVDIDARAGAQACKIYNPQSTEERQYLQAKLERMERQRIIRGEQFSKAVTLAQSLDAKVPTEPVTAERKD